MYIDLVSCTAYWLYRLYTLPKNSLGNQKDTFASATDTKGKLWRFFDSPHLRTLTWTCSHIWHCHRYCESRPDCIHIVKLINPVQVNGTLLPGRCDDACSTADQYGAGLRAVPTG